MSLRSLTAALLVIACTAAEPPATVPPLPGWQGVPGANLIYNPGFELGGDGWFYECSWPKQAEDYRRTRDAGTVAILPQGGADGGACLALPGGGVSLRSWCFPIEPGRRYSLSLQARRLPGAAKGDCVVMAFDPEWGGALFTKVGDLPGDAWKRCVWPLTFKPNPQRKAYIRFASETGALIDTVQLEAGEPTPYQAPVGLAVERDGKPYAVRGRDPTDLRIRVVPGTAGGGPIAVSAVARDAWGREAWRQEFTVSGDAPSATPVQAPQTRLGNFHVELTARRDGAVVGIGASRYAILDPAVRETVAAGRIGGFGICYELFNYPPDLNREAGRYLADLGVRTIRFFATLPEGLDDGIMRDLVARCAVMREAGIAVLPCLNLFPGTTAMGEELAMPEAGMLARYREQLTGWFRAMKSEVHAIEILNEPNLWRVAKGPDRGKRTVSPAKYLAIQQAAYAAIKGVDPDCLVVCPALNCMDWEWVREWMKLGGGRWMDVFSFHPYRGSPDEPSMHADIGRMTALLRQGGFAGPLLDSEFYFAANNFQERGGYGETRRNYYLPHDQELQAAGRTVRALIHHAAAGVPACPFNPGGTFFQFEPADSLFLYDLFPACNATSRMLADCGRGEQLATGPSFTAFLFPQAAGGPLAAVWTAQAGVVGSMRLPGPHTVFDVMGNRRDPADGIRLATDPTWLRFPVGSDPAALRTAIATAEVHGLGMPLEVALVPTGVDGLAARITSCANRPLDGSVRVLSAPDGWRIPQRATAFTGLAVGGSVDLPLPIAGLALADLASYPLALQAEAGGETVRVETCLRPLFARHLPAVTVDGDLGEWTQARWIALGDAALSKDFDPRLPRTGDADLSARMAVGWTATGLALAVVVTDDVNHPAEGEAIGWQGDSLQLFIDQRGDAARADPGEADDVRCTIGAMGGRTAAWLDKGAEGNFKGANNRTDGFADPDVQVAIVRSGSTTTYEILLPGGRCLPAVRLAAGSICGLSILVNDNDGKGRKTGVTTSPPGTEPYGAPWAWPRLVLIP